MAIMFSRSLSLGKKDLERRNLSTGSNVEKTKRNT
jgi:hypothetical protein